MTSDSILPDFRFFLEEMRDVGTLGGDRYDEMAVAGPVIQMLLGQMYILGVAVYELMRADLIDAAPPLVRAIGSGALNIACISENAGEANGRGLAFLLFSRTLRRKAVEREVANRELDAEEGARILEAEEAYEGQLLEDLRSRGVHPIKLGPGRSSWHGLTDAALAGRLQMGNWYSSDYSLYSDYLHLNVRAVTISVVGRESVTATGLYRMRNLEIIQAVVSAVVTATDMYTGLIDTLAPDYVRHAARRIQDAIDTERGFGPGFPIPLAVDEAYWEDEDDGLS